MKTTHLMGSLLLLSLTWSAAAHGGNLSSKLEDGVLVLECKKSRRSCSAITRQVGSRLHVFELNEQERTYTYAFNDVERITFKGGRKNDHFGNETDIPVVARGNSGKDKLYGGGGDDELFGGNGDDRIEGRAGDDTIDGGPGDDLIWGNKGADTIEGGDGEDTIKGGAGDDSLHGGEDTDDIYGGDGNDVIHGGQGGNHLWGGAGDDTLYAEGYAVENYLFGGGGNDELHGRNKRDALVGGAGTDEIYCKFGSSEVWVWPNTNPNHEVYGLIDDNCGSINKSSDSVASEGYHPPH